MRADLLLVQRSLAATRSQAQRLIAAGVQWRVPGGAWQAVRKSGEELPPTAELQLQDAAEARYVSRGGLKLEGALAACALNVRGLRCLDVGQSTGGFTDCLLQHGAAHVTGVDVGHGQLHPRLAADARVRCLQGINARHLQPALFATPSHPPHQPPAKPPESAAATGAAAPKAAAGIAGFALDSIAHAAHGACANGHFDAHSPPAEGLAEQAARPPDPCAVPAAGFDLIVGDVSFISLTLVLPALVPLLNPQGHVLLLAKPQFELQPQHIGKGGIVRDAALYPLVRQRLQSACRQAGLAVRHWLPSPIAGGDGNREFFIHASAPPA